MIDLKVALFDLDGTLVDSEGQYTKCWTEIGRRFRPDCPTLAHDIKGTTLTQILSRFFPDEGIQKEVINAIESFEATMDFPLIDGAEEFIRNLKEHGVKCAIVTSSDAKKMSHVWEKQRDFMSLFDRVLTAEDFSASKPDPDCYLKGATAFGAKLNQCIVFEDALTGLQAGMSSGIFTIGLPTGNPREVIADKCHHIIDNFVGIDYDYLIQLR